MQAGSGEGMQLGFLNCLLYVPGKKNQNKNVRLGRLLIGRGEGLGGGEVGLKGLSCKIHPFTLSPRTHHMMIICQFTIDDMQLSHCIDNK